MRTKPEVFDDPAAFRAAQSGKAKKRKSAKEARPDIPRAVNAQGEGDKLAALGRLAVYGYMPRWRAGAGYDFWTTDGRFTTPSEDYATAVALAEKEAKQ